MKRFLGIVTVVGVVLGGATVGYMQMSEPETYTQEIIETVKEQVTPEPTEEEKQVAALLAVEILREKTTIPQPLAPEMSRWSARRSLR
jgi:hypothetical protein